MEFAYTGKIELAGPTVVGIIRAANVTGEVTAVEAAAVEFLSDRLDPGNCFTAMALGLQRTCRRARAGSCTTGAWPSCARASSR